MPVPFDIDLNAEDETYAQKVQRITQRELHRGLRASPDIIEDILMVDMLAAKENSPNFTLNFDSVLDICRFSQKTKWLCPWGVEYFDETHRDPIRDLPQRVLEIFLSLENDEDYYTQQLLTQKEVAYTIADESNHFDRVFLYQQENLDCLENLYKHPCEELHVTYSSELRRKDVENIVRCKTLRVLRISCAAIPISLRPMLAQLQHLEILHYESFDLVSTQIETLRLFPRLHNMEIAVTRDTFSPEHAIAVITLIQERKETLRHVKLSLEVPHEMLVALAACRNLQSFSLDQPRMTDEDLHPFFSNRHVQKTLRNVDLSRVSIKEPTFAFLAEFKNLRTLDLSMTDVSYEEAAKILESNAATIRSVDFTACKKLYVGNDLLSAIEKCAHLERVDVRNNFHINKFYVKQFKKEKRRNHQAVWVADEYVPGLAEVCPRPESETDASDNEWADTDASTESGENSESSWDSEEEDEESEEYTSEDWGTEEEEDAWSEYSYEEDDWSDEYEEEDYSNDDYDTEDDEGDDFDLAEIIRRQTPAQILNLLRRAGVSAPARMPRSYHR